MNVIKQGPVTKGQNSGEDQSLSEGVGGQPEGRLRFLLCRTLDCIIEKDIRSCFECDEFPCQKLQE
ncbi:DUF3795 domain-containing protein [Pelotomaculum sp. PtaB.Bin117]|uniref:DUF3795 domain-containing protein n=1 Tax=Pelotomaculum sp. PtaB.Bin117 TaxID=1811694 RepID=UPI0009CA6058|nr:DUF3795 domain-containing protein [Pelotomaculum sp. PtaB.Bin117]OPX87050.1 MAG: hypothetical protein A4E54_01809 [Pelotomaculum sp. PtaB.Bin117]